MLRICTLEPEDGVIAHGWVGRGKDQMWSVQGSEYVVVYRASLQNCCYSSVS